MDQLYETLFKETCTNVTAALLANPARTYAAEITVRWPMSAAAGIVAHIGLKRHPYALDRWNEGATGVQQGCNRVGTGLKQDQTVCSTGYE